MSRSRLLQSIERKIAAAARMPLERDCLLCEKAIYLARLTTDAEPKDIIDKLHHRYSSSPNIRMSIWLNLAEGLYIYYRDMGVEARDKVLRAYALSAAADIKPLRALSAAWLAQMEYMRHGIDAMARYLKESLVVADAAHHAARSRACIVAAQALHHAGRLDLASYWNDRARFHALEDGDDATISALIHNMAWLRMLTWRQAVLTGSLRATDGEYALMSAESTSNFDALVGADTLTVLHPLLKAQIFSLQNKPSDALHLYERHLLHKQGADFSRLEGNLLSDRAWCHALLDQCDEAHLYASLANKSINEKTHVDDKAATHSRLSEVYRLLKNSDLQTLHAQLAEVAWANNKLLQAKVVELLENLTDAQEDQLRNQTTT